MADIKKIGNATIMNVDCMEYMRSLPDKFFDLAIVDPPYGIGATNGTGKYGRLKFQQKKECWDTETPKKEYWKQLFSVSKNQIVWGGNYFGLPPTRGFFIWDKGEGFYGRDFAECEYGWTSFDRNAKILKRDPLAKRDFHEGKIHPTQKPVKLYEWILTNYAKPGQKIFDSHMGSGSSAIACNNLGFEFIGCELDEDYYNAACERIAQHAQQQRLFA